MNNSARQIMKIVLSTRRPSLSLCGENTRRLATNFTAWRWTPKVSPSSQAMRWSVTNTQWRTAACSRSHYKPFERIGQRVFFNPTDQA
ncbi:hypothetical protein SBV1_1910005 [Verrucomicrobia bacterium]|nr:hypothetical protein SBV1_1910005 [Verrucomicrobiota bacterium]